MYVLTVKLCYGFASLRSFTTFKTVVGIPAGGSLTEEPSHGVGRESVVQIKVLVTVRAVEDIGITA